MKLFLRKILIKALHPFGFYITYYASANRVYDALSKHPTIIQEYELKRIFDTIGIAKNHNFYNNLLAKFIPSWNLKIKNAKFIGFGAGESSLSTFRRVRIQYKTFHEKIYFSSHHDIQRISWFYQNVYDLVQEYGIAVPSRFKIFSGNPITAVYTDYVELEKINTLEKEESLVSFSNKLYQLSLTEEFKLISEKTPAYIKNFKNHFEYKKNRSGAKEILNKNGISIEAIEEKIMQFRYALTHGDIQDTNAFERNILIDWDSVGIFPAGFDSAFSLFYLMIKKKVLEEFDILNWIDVHYKKSIKNNEWESFQLSFLFFLFVFIQGRIEKENCKTLNKQLIKQLRKHN